MAKQTKPRGRAVDDWLDELKDIPIDREERRREMLRRKGVANAVAAAKAVEPMLKEAFAER